MSGCPNTPPCPHGALMHDIDTPDDPKPICCYLDCRCGDQYQPGPATAGSDPD